MRSWIAVVLIAGIISSGRAQITASAVGAETSSAPQVQEEVDGLGISLKSLPKNIWQDQQKLLMSRFYIHEWERNSAVLKTNMSSKDLAGGGNLVRFEGNDNFLSHSLLGHAVDSEVGQSHSTDANTVLRELGDIEREEDRERSSGTGYKASNYAPLDSWIYPVFDRLAAMGYLPTSTATVRPWTRLECARLLAEAHDSIDEVDETTGPLLAALDLEFVHETSVIDGTSRNTGAQVESAYDRFTGISGTPLRDGFHFGQTLVDDYGRPYGKGANSITGTSGRAEVGPLAFYIRGEYQYASAMPAYSAEAQQTIAAYDGLPFGWNMRFGTTSRIRPIEAYAALNLANWQISFGQQSLWWGPDRTTSLILSNNAAAMPMLRLARIKPAKMPGILNLFGPVHFDAFFSRQGGVHYVGLGPTFTLYGSASQPLTPPPYLWGLTLSIKPTRNFEMGFAHTTIFAGYGRPLNLSTFFHTFSPQGNGQEVDPGKRATEFNFTYHVPGLRRSVVVYTEEFAWDDPIEGKFVARYAMDPGIYIPRLPGLKKLDLRMEGAYTNLPKLADQAYFYSNAHYPQGYTNYGQILGSWIGRQGSGGQASSSYWFSARNKATVSYRKMSADKSFLQGGNMNDFSGNMTWLIRPEIELSAMGQYERWNFPLLGAGAKSNFTSTFEVRIFPKARAGSE